MPNYDVAILHAELKRDEDERLKPYRDSVGKLSIGIGRNLDDCGISADESAFLFYNDLKLTEQWLNRNIPWWTQLDGVRQRVFVNMAFNMRSKLLGFANFLAAAHEGQWQKAHDEMLDSLWAKQVGARAVRLAQMMLKGSV